MTDRERQALARQTQAEGRGRPLGNGTWRNYCCVCDAPIAVRREWLRTKTDLTCDECRPPVASGNTMSSALGPWKDKR